MLCIGHRGTRIGFDENTLGAFLASIKAGADCIEFDIRKTFDNKLVIMHDSTLQRTTNCSGEVEKLMLSEIKKCRTIYKNEKVPTLQEIIQIIPDNVQMMIELKGPKVKNMLVNLLENKPNKKNIIFSGRNIEDLCSLKMRFPEYPICYNITKGKNPTLENFLERKEFEFHSKKPEMISLKSNLITKKFIQICNKFDVLALAWNFIEYEQPVSKIKDLIDMGIDGILFDDYKNINKIKSSFLPKKN